MGFNSGFKGLIGATPMKSYVKRKEAENLRYKSLRIGIQRLWNMKGMVMPVIIEPIGIVTKV